VNLGQDEGKAHFDFFFFFSLLAPRRQKRDKLASPHPVERSAGNAALRFSARVLVRSHLFDPVSDGDRRREFARESEKYFGGATDFEKGVASRLSGRNLQALRPRGD